MSSDKLFVTDSNVWTSSCFALFFLPSLFISWRFVDEMSLLDAAWTCAPKIPAISFSHDWQVWTFSARYSIYRYYAFTKALPKRTSKVNMWK
jgi:hypothetical protein